MAKKLKYLQNPYIKIFASPLSTVLLGIILGMNNTRSWSWLGIFLIALITISLQLIDHFLYQNHVLQNTNQTPSIIFYLCEAILLISSLGFILTNYWVLNLLLLVIISIYHIQYFPYALSNTFLQFLLLVMANSLFFNAIAYYNQVSQLSTSFLTQLVPFVLLNIGSMIQVFHLRYQDGTRPMSPLYQRTSAILIVLSIGLAFYLSLPSKSFFLVQILFLIISSFTAIPLLISVKGEKGKQNKINYLSAYLLIFSLLYALALIF